jgi:hypothetical protein
MRPIVNFLFTKNASIKIYAIRGQNYARFTKIVIFFEGLCEIYVI